MPKMLTIRALGVQQLRRRLSAGAEYVEDPRDGLEAVAEDMMRVIGATFDSQGRRYGGSWRPLTEKWLQYKIRHGKDPRILHYNLHLRNAFTVRGDQHQILNITKSSISLRSDLPYANATNRERPFIQFYPQDKDRWVRIMEREIMAAMRYI